MQTTVHSPENTVPKTEKSQQNLCEVTAICTEMLCICFISSSQVSTPTKDFFVVVVGLGCFAFAFFLVGWFLGVLYLFIQVVCLFVWAFSGHIYSSELLLAFLIKTACQLVYAPFLGRDTMLRLKRCCTCPLG